MSCRRGCRMCSMNGRGGHLNPIKKNICGIWVQISLRQGLGGGHALQIILNIEVIHRLFLSKDLWAIPELMCPLPGEWSPLPGVAAI